VRSIDPPRSGLAAASPPGGQRQRTGAAGSAACAWRLCGMVIVSTLAGCSAPRGPSSSAPQAPVVSARPAAPAVSNARYRNWDEFRIHAGRRIVDANPNGTFTGVVPEPLLAIPVLEVELNGDGSVRRILVQRQPSQAGDTVQLAIDAVNRAAPFGDVSHLPRPWKFSEVFLFREDRKFKPRALDL